MMNFESEFGVPESATSKLKNPGVTFVHFFFRVSALFIYLLGGYFSNSFIGLFVTIVLLLSIDFWTVKNITGRIMVGLRWWNYIDEEGVSQWKFEARNGESVNYLSKSEVRLFWAGLILVPAFWTLFFFTALFGFKFQWLILVVIGLTLSGSNLLGYLRCRIGNTSSVKNLADTYIRKQMFASAMNMFKSGAAGGQSTNSATNVI